ncbi:MAG: UvrD-helicase domain-containing protein [Holophagaceae bacterium]|nr:UvrD-helicase domain-containing protein [Holophagaceae bacterium]
MSRLPALNLADPALAAGLPGRSLAISAGAGSGKTFTLVALVLGFLGRDGARAFEVMATTFGRESAADLKARILGPLDKLAQWDWDRWNEALAGLRTGWEAWDAVMAAALAPGEIALAARQWSTEGRWPDWASTPEKARAHWIRTRREAESLEVSTVHGVALDILRRAGQAGADLLTADDPRMVALLRRAGREVLELPVSHRDHGAARKLLGWLEGEEAGEPRWQRISEAFDAHTDALGTWREDTDTGETADAFWAAAGEWVEAYRPFGETPIRAAKVTKKGQPHGNFIRHGLKKMAPAPPADAPRLGWLRFAESLAASFPKDDGEFPAQYLSEEFLEAMAPLGGALPDLLEHWLSLLLEQVFRRFLALKEDRRWLSYGDLVRRAHAHLRAVPPGRHPRLLLVDEFQDINPVQEVFLDALDAEATVVVGDPKQAIYGFRGGVAELLKQRIGKAAAHGLAFRLPRNHRSTAPVVKVANTFAQDIVPLLDAGAADPDGVQDDTGTARGEAMVALARVDSEHPKAADLPAAAAWIAALAGETGWQGLGMKELACAGPRRRALLLPGRNGLPALRRALQRRGVEPLVQTRDGFWESPGVRLVMALLECLAHPERPLPLFAVLRSPWIGATDRELLEQAERLRGGLRDSSAAALSPPQMDGIRWLQGLRGLSAQRVAAEGLARTGLLESIASTEVHGRLEPERARRNLDQFLGLLPSLPSDVSSAFSELDRLRARPRGDAPAEGAAANLLIQTVHASKGLEYEDVLLPMLNYSVKGIRKGEVGRGARQHLLLGWKLGKLQASGYRRLKQEEDARVRREGLNLMYVALTRARHRMVLLQQWSWDPAAGAFQAPPPASKRKEEKKASNWQHIASEFAARLPDLPCFDAPPAQHGSAASEPRAPRQAPGHTRPPSISGILVPSGDSPERSDRKRQGTALHGLLRDVLVRHAIDPEAAEAHLRANPAVARWPQAADQVRRFLAALQIQGWERFPRRTEFPLPDARGPGRTGFADLVIWEPDRADPDRIHLVDFKLAEGFGEFELEAYRVQLGGYRQALARLHPGIEVRAWLYAIEGGRFMEA